MIIDNGNSKRFEELKTSYVEWCRVFDYSSIEGLTLLETWWGNFKYKDFISFQPISKSSGLAFTYLNGGIESIQVTASSCEIGEDWESILNDYIDKQLFELSTVSGIIKAELLKQLLDMDSGLISSNFKWKHLISNKSHVKVTYNNILNDDEILVSTNLNNFEKPLLWCPFIIAPLQGIISDEWKLCLQHKDSIKLYRVIE
jgi:hypothetical protein